ncbi:TIR domain-containing protein [Hydrogenovibrio kuenenii]|uniref:TIR domain-containing protein n=1 Tax=Hydrogenovibrio kuenenii TaxID=63658 RepID=UPI0004B5814F|nr:TIR domain-containing protein [Hydrogenovibrio kuenenii]
MAVLLRIALGTAAAIAALAILNKKKKVFVSYYYDEDKHYKRLLNAWSANKRFELEFDDISTDVSIKSENKTYIRKRISEKIKACDIFVVFVGKESHEREWISWEINQAKTFNKKIVAIKEKRNYASPKPLLSSGATWVFGLNEKKIREAIEG